MKTFPLTEIIANYRKTNVQEYATTITDMVATFFPAFNIHFVVIDNWLRTTI